ncbi:hypothetical protein PMIN04_001108 [Paraphaeosphaeria minitans]
MLVDSTFSGAWLLLSFPLLLNGASICSVQCGVVDTGQLYFTFFVPSSFQRTRVSQPCLVISHMEACLPTAYFPCRGPDRCCQLRLRQGYNTTCLARHLQVVRSLFRLLCRRHIESLRVPTPSTQSVRYCGCLRCHCDWVTTRYRENRLPSATTPVDRSAFIYPRLRPSISRGPPKQFDFLRQAPAPHQPSKNPEPTSPRLQLHFPALPQSRSQESNLPTADTSPKPSCHQHQTIQVQPLTHGPRCSPATTPRMPRRQRRGRRRTWSISAWGSF